MICIFHDAHSIDWDVPGIGRNGQYTGEIISPIFVASGQEFGEVALLRRVADFDHL